jgi:two-component system C4-dicarboxylate transport sensor histidine kinase DctB
MTNPPSPNSPSSASEESLVAALAAHDIKNLLGVVIGNADIQNLWAQRQAGDGSQVSLEQGLADLGRSLETIRLSAAHAMTLCEDMLAIADGRPPQMRPVALKPLVEESVEIFRGRCGGVAAVTAVGQADLHIHGHRTDLQRTLINLMWNAFEAMDGQPDRELLVRWGERDGAAFVEVVDNGPGLPDGHLADLTRPFHSNKSGEGKVRGLGLYSAARVMRQHGGRLLGRNRETARGAILSLQFGLERELDFSAPQQPAEEPKELEA